MTQSAFCKCGNQRREGQYNCLSCHAKANEAYRRRRSPTAVKQDYARNYASSYLSRGKLAKLPCVFCSSTDVIMHHANLDKPLEVTWLCRECRDACIELAGSGRDITPRAVKEVRAHLALEARTSKISSNTCSEK